MLFNVFMYFVPNQVGTLHTLISLHVANYCVFLANVASECLKRLTSVKQTKAEMSFRGLSARRFHLQKEKFRDMSNYLLRSSHVAKIFQVFKGLFWYILKSQFRKTIEMESSGKISDIIMQAICGRIIELDRFSLQYMQYTICIVVNQSQFHIGHGVPPAYNKSNELKQAAIGRIMQKSFLFSKVLKIQSLFL